MINSFQGSYMFWHCLKKIGNNSDYEASIKKLIDLFSGQLKIELNKTLALLNYCKRNLNKVVESNEMFDETDLIWIQLDENFSTLKENFKAIKKCDDQQVKLFLAQSILILNFFEYSLSPVYFESALNSKHANQCVAKSKEMLAEIISNCITTHTNLTLENNTFVRNFIKNSCMPGKKEGDNLQQSKKSRKRKRPINEQARDNIIKKTHKCYLNQLTKLLDECENSIDKNGVTCKIASYNKLGTCISGFKGWLNNEGQFNIPFLVLLSQEYGMKIDPELRRFLRLKLGLAKDILQFYEKKISATSETKKVLKFWGKTEKWEEELNRINNEFSHLGKKFRPEGLFNSSPPAKRRRLNRSRSLYMGDDLYLQASDYQKSGEIVRADEVCKGLFDAVKRQDIPYVREFISGGGYPINRIDKDGNNILHYAIETGNPMLIELICESMSPEDINLQGSFGNTPLHLAIGDDNITRILISFGAEKSNHIRNRFFITPNVDSNFISITPKFDREFKLSRNNSYRVPYIETYQPEAKI